MREPKPVQDDTPEKCILARLILPQQTVDEDPLEELHGLAKTAGTEVVDELIQRRETPDHSTYLGKGKVQELKELVEQNEAEVVIFDNDLTPAQVRNLEKAVKAKVLDRTELILDIFAAGARTHESRLAIELAQLEYSLPRLKRMWTHLSRQAMGVGMRGPGEKQLEVDRRLAQKRIHDLKEELSKVERRREREVEARSDIPTISLVGYTNAGKSTLMNALTQAEVLAKDKLFATLDTRTRRWTIPDWGTVLLSDTVGFIRDLPHSLVASFKSTLEETRQADLLIHVADASSPAVFNQIHSVYLVLKELGIEAKDTLLVLNKVDAIYGSESLNRILNRYPHAIPVSAKTGLGFNEFIDRVGQALSREFLDIEVDLEHSDGRLLSYLSEKSEVISRQYGETHVTLSVRIPAGAMGPVRRSAIAIRNVPRRSQSDTLPPAQQRPPSTDDSSINTAGIDANHVPSKTVHPTDSAPTAAIKSADSNAPN